MAKGLNDGTESLLPLIISALIIGSHCDGLKTFKWYTTGPRGSLGLTFPGMIEEPGAMAGRLISLKPARGPEESSRRSLQIFDTWV